MAGPVAEYVQMTEQERRQEKERGWHVHYTDGSSDQLSVFTEGDKFRIRRENEFSVGPEDYRVARTRFVQEFDSRRAAEEFADRWTASEKAQIAVVRREHEAGMAEAEEILKLREQTPQRREQLEYMLDQERSHLRDNGVDPVKAWGQAAHNVLRTNLEAERATIRHQLQNIFDIPPKDLTPNLAKGYGRVREIDRELAAEQDLGFGYL
jgi:hypothetical protein